VKDLVDGCRHCQYPGGGGGGCALEREEKALDVLV
jgi:hypothetical protein